MGHKVKPEGWRLSADSERRNCVPTHANPPESAHNTTMLMNPLETHCMTRDGLRSVCMTHPHTHTHAARVRGTHLAVCADKYICLCSTRSCRHVQVT